MMRLGALLIWFIICAEQDARRKEISNGLTIGGIAVAAGYLSATGTTWLGAPAIEAGLALLVAMALTLPGYFIGRLGAGDVKLMTALALASDSTYLLGTFIGAGVALLSWRLIGKRAWPLIQQRLTQRYACMNPEASDKYPFSPFLLIGLLLTAWALH
ncbi:prepilin peptidase [Pseudomonas syringae]|nr:prepilin peptidase [Pseudomonas syringae]